MINSLTDLDKAIKNDQQIEVRASPESNDWERTALCDLMVSELGDIISLINHNMLRVSQVKQ